MIGLVRMPECAVCGGHGHTWAGYGRRLDPSTVGPLPWETLTVALCREHAQAALAWPGWALVTEEGGGAEVIDLVPRPSNVTVNCTHCGREMVTAKETTTPLCAVCCRP